MTQQPTALDLRPLTARSAILSVLLGAHPPEATGRALVEWGRGLGISEQAVRVALTRMVAAGDLDRRDGVHRLSPRLLARQERQDAALVEPPGPWDGTWFVAVVTEVGADPSRRASLRQRMIDDRFAELREGVWTRPANLDWSPSADARPSLELLSARPGRDPRDLASDLFDPDGWSAMARVLSDRLAGESDLAARTTVAAAIVRHLVADPLLPRELLPDDWPGTALRETYAAFRAELIKRWRS